MSTLIDNLNYIESCKMDIRSAIEAKGVDMTGVTLSGYADAIGEIQTGGGDFDQKSITEKDFQITVLRNNASFVGSYIFQYNSYIQTVSLPECSKIYQYAFQNCSSLTQVSLPECTTVNDGAFANCNLLTQVSFPVCKYIGYSAFQRCSSLTQVSLPICSLIQSYAFQGCSSLTQVNLPECEYIGDSGFQACLSISQISIPKCSYIGQYAFQGCSSLTQVSLPFTNVQYSAFQRCSSLEVLSIDQYGYAVIKYNSMLTNTKIASGIGSIYVPYALYEKYVSANGWSSLSERFVSYGDPSYLALSFSDGLVYGSTPYLDYYFNSHLGISYNQVKEISLPNCSIIYNQPGYNNKFVFSTQLSSYLESIYLGELSSVYSSMFVYCTKLKMVDLPSCEYVGTTAFLACNSLTQVSLPICSYIGTYAFQSCINLSYINLPECNFVDEGGFRYCKNLRTVDFGVCSSISQSGFSSCNNLSVVILRGSVVCSIEGNTFYSTKLSQGFVYVPASLVSDYRVAEHWSSYNIESILEELEFSNGFVYGWASYMDSGYLNELNITASDVTSVSMSFLTSISSSTFMNHYNMVSFDTPLLKEYPDDAFNGCSSLEMLKLDVSIMGDRVFANCTGLTTVNISYSGVISVGEDIFNNCTNLSTINIPYEYYDNYTTADGWSEYSSLMVRLEPPLMFIDGLVSGTIDRLESNYLASLGITSNQVVSVSLSQCTYLGYKVFNEHHSLLDLSLPNVTYIESQAFFGANYINDLVLPKCSYIGNGAFSWTGIGNFRNLTLGYSSVVNVGGNIYLSGNMSHIYVPSSLVDDYKVAYYWSTFARIITAIPEE